MTDLLCASPRCKPPTRHKPDCDGDPQTPCRGCLPARAADGLRLCWHCTDRLGNNAVEAAGLWSELGLALVGGGVGDEIRQRNPGAGLNLKPAIIDHRAAIRHTLVSWTQLVTEERGISLPWRWRMLTLPAGVEGPLWRKRAVDQDTKTLGKFVQTHAQWLAAQAFADEAADEFAALVETARSLRQPSSTRIIEIGPCPRVAVDEETDEQLPCSGTLRALLRSEASLLPSAVQCDASEDHAWDSTQWTKLGRRMPKKENPLILRPAPKTLQERLDQTRADYARDGVKDRFPVAVSVNGARPVYGEFSQTAEADDRMTRFGSTGREFVTSFAWSLTVEQKMDWSDRPVPVRFGEEKALNYEGNVRIDRVTSDGFVWTTKLIGLGELKRYGQTARPEGKMAA